MNTGKPMSYGYQALTEKEKETLRLLVNGHDAKSMARQLGLSVHTINERLRDARRKMAVSSSREAARQLRKAESHDPEFQGDELLRDAAVTSGMGELQPPVEVPGAQRRFGWVIGGLLMSISLALLALSSLSGSSQAPIAASQSAITSTPATEAAAVQSARQWLEIVDAGKWNESWDASGQSFKSLNTSDKWAAVSQEVRKPLGVTLSRKLIGEDYVPAPPYGYRVVRFRTSFANKADATETISLEWENERWRVVGCTIE